jgi:hypothetical protein
MNFEHAKGDDMELITQKITIPTVRTEVKIVCMGCVHHGAAGCNETLADFWYNRILTTPNTFVILGGDMVDAIHEKDKRYAEQEVAPWCLGTGANRKRWGGTVIDRQYNYGVEKWKPLADAGKILWIHKGNHEEKLVTTASRDLTLDWSRALGVPFAGLAALSNLFITPANDKRGMAGYRVSFFTTHGGGSAQTDGAVLNKAMGMLRDYDVDVALMWHVHKKAHATKTMLGVSATGRRTVRDRIGAVCGTFLDGHIPGVTGYAELKGYGPTPLGPQVIHIKREVQARPKGDAGRGTGYTRIWLSDAIVGERL